MAPYQGPESRRPVGSNPCRGFEPSVTLSLSHSSDLSRKVIDTSPYSSLPPPISVLYRASLRFRQKHQGHLERVRRDGDGYEYQGRTYLVMANEGDARDNGGADGEDGRRG